MKVSSTWALRAPVWVHWARNLALEWRAIPFIVTTDTGMVITATSARTHEMVNIITTTPITVRTEVRIWQRVCWRLWATLSMSLVTRLSRSPRGWPST